jgi:hypothetical protein
MDNLMLKTRENTEFDRWWKDWISKRTQNPVLVGLEHLGRTCAPSFKAPHTSGRQSRSVISRSWDNEKTSQ